jgi:hypothetical protein
MRHPDVCVLEVADESAAVLSCGPEEDLSDSLLKLLVAEELGLLHGASSLRTVRKQRGLRLAALEQAGDRPRSLHPLTVDLGCGHGHVGESERLEHHPRDDRQKVGPLVVDPLVIEQQLTRRCGVRAGHRKEPDIHGRPTVATNAREPVDRLLPRPPYGEHTGSLRPTTMRTLRMVMNVDPGLWPTCRSSGRPA